MRKKNSIVYPILGMLALLISFAAIFHYSAQVTLLQNTVKIIEEKRSEDILFAIQTLVNKETEKLSALTKSLKEQDELVWEIAYYSESGENIEYLRGVMDRIYNELKIDIFIATDNEGKIIYQAHDPEKRGNYFGCAGISKVLAGQDRLMSDCLPAGWIIMSMEPAKRESNLYGLIIIGTRIDNNFAVSIADATHVDVTFASAEGIFASTVSEATQEKYIADAVFIKSLKEEKKILLGEPDSFKAVFYAPLDFASSKLSLIVEMDTSESRMLLAEHRRQIATNTIILLLFTLLIGTMVTLYYIRPLKALAKQSKEVAQVLSEEEIAEFGGNEIQHLVLSFNALVSTVERYARERLEAEAALLDEKQRLAVTIRSIGDAVISTDNNGRIILINAVAEELTGWEDGEAIGQPLVNVYNTLDRKTREPSDDFVALVLEAERIVEKSIPSILKSRDGSEKIISEIGAPVRDEESKVIGVVVAFSDITERLKIEEELLKAKKLEAVGILAGGIAHDFNNILTAIMGNISLSKHYIDRDNKAYMRLEEADRAAARAKDLTYKLLTFSKGGAPVKQAASIEELIRESTGFILSGTSAKAKFTFAEDLWPVQIDPGQISQVIQNLCLNANQAMPGGGVISIRAENEVINEYSLLPLLPGKYIKISFKDSGVGISQKNIGRIFDPYFTTKQKGSGLGLATVYSIINNHEGFITVESELDAGTTFTFYLPVKETGMTPADEAVEERQEFFKGSGRILVMDDEEIVREVAGEILDHLGFEVDFALHGEEALDKYTDAQRKGKPFDVVIMDLTIPGGMGGAETIKKLLEIDPEAKAVVSSGYSNDPIMADYEKYGFKGMISKPFQIDEFQSSLETVLNLEKV